MKKINQKILSIPPYISTSWKNIHSLHMKEIEGKPILIIALHNGISVNVPGIEKTLIKEIFEAHSRYVEQETKEPQFESLKTYKPSKDSDISFPFGLPSQVREGNYPFNPTSFLEHNPNQANAPEMPIEVIEKITSITKALGMDMEKLKITKAEPHCNCPYCQIARVVQGISGASEEVEEEVSDEDLKFRDWDIKQEGNKLYIVSNPLNTEEHYQVYLGNPIGCTCGKKNCEHVRTVLNS
ncbi:MAG: hypothetical protein QNJ27_01755 [Simkaniaceae bacterium]|nr:hypothetical protein [Simkaniaceae bacterium]